MSEQDQADAAVPAEFLLRIDRDRLRHQLAEAKKEIERLEMCLRYAEAAIDAEYRLRVGARFVHSPIAASSGNATQGDG